MIRRLRRWSCGSRRPVHPVGRTCWRSPWQPAGRAGERTRNLLIRCRRMLAEVQQKQALFGKNEKEVDPEILAEAKEIVDDHDEEIAELEQELRELEAAGTKDKKENREMKSDPGYMAAQRMLKDPVKELAAREKLAEERARVEVQMSNMKNPTWRRCGRSSDA